MTTTFATGRRANALPWILGLCALVVLVGIVVAGLLLPKSEEELAEALSDASSRVDTFQNARASIQTIRREVAGTFSLDSNQEFIIHNPRTATGAIDWSQSDPSFPDVRWTRPFLVTITQTAWIDPSVPAQPKVTAAAKVAYRLRHDPTGLNDLPITTVTLERVLLSPLKAGAGGIPPWPNGYCAAQPSELDTRIDPKESGQRIRARDSAQAPDPPKDGTLLLREDLCKFIRYEPATETGAFHLEFLYVDPSNAPSRFFYEPGESSDNYPATPVAPVGDTSCKLIHFVSDSRQAAPYQKLPINIRIKMEVVDKQDGEVRTMASEIWIPAAGSQ